MRAGDKRRAGALQVLPRGGAVGETGCSDVVAVGVRLECERECIGGWLMGADWAGGAVTAGSSVD